MMYNYTFEELLDKTLLIGLTYYSKYGELIERKQLFGTVIKSDNNGITIRQTDNKTFTLPPYLSFTYLKVKASYFAPFTVRAPIILLHSAKPTFSANRIIRRLPDQVCV